MNEEISKASDTEIAITTTQVVTIPLTQLQNRLKMLTNQLVTIQRQIDLVTSRIAQATALGVSERVAVSLTDEATL